MESPYSHETEESIMAKVSFENVVKKYGDVTAVNNLNIDVADKEFLVFVGPSGCGKTTALRCLAGLEEITDGTIRIGERVVNDVAPKDRDIAMVFQSYALYPHLSVFDNMAFGLKLRKVPKDEIKRRVREAADVLNIHELLDRKPRQLSGGQRQRVALGRAIVREPLVFLFDEPLSNLDAKLRVQTRTELTKLHQRLGTTFIYVTHDQVEAMTMATRIAVIKDGLLQQVGTPEELYFRPENVFVAGFIGSPSMNFFPVALTGSGEEMVIDAQAFQIRLPAARAARLSSFTGTEAIMGIRPEDIYDTGFEPAGITGQRVRARVDPRTRARAGEDIDLMLDTDRVHLFYASTSKALDLIDIPGGLPEVPEKAAAEAPPTPE